MNPVWIHEAFLGRRAGTAKRRFREAEFARRLRHSRITPRIQPEVVVIAVGCEKARSRKGALHHLQPQL
jgi:hypothetical protein